MSNEIARVGQQAVARPDYVERNDAGTENIANEDIQIPRLALAQKMSPEVDNSTSKYIEGLTEGNLFNSLTSEIYGTGPLNFAVIRVDKPRAIEFYPIADGGGVKDPNVPLDDDRLKFTNDASGKTIKPLATKFYDFIIVPIDEDGTVQTGDVMALSLKSTGVKIAKQLNGLIKLRGKAPVFSGLYTLGVRRAQNKTGQVYHTFTVTNARQNDGWVAADAYTLLKSLYESFIDATVSVDYEHAAVDPEADGNDMSTGAGDGKVPF